MDSIILNVKDLEAAERQRYETVLGQQLEDNQQIIMTVVPTSSENSSDERAQAWADLQQLSKKAEQHMRSTGTTDQQWEAAADAACEEVRYGKQSG